MNTALPRESKTLEYKEVPSSIKSADFKTYLKTVSAYANYITGEIRFGVSDDRQIKGIDNPEKFCLDIENQINDALQPVPEFSLDILEDSTVTLTVQKGKDTPYLYKGIAYYRRDSSSVPADRQQLQQLSLYGANLSYENLPARTQNLTFQTFSAWCEDKISANIPMTDLLKTFQMYSDEGGYTNAALLLSDENSISGISIIQFGSTTNEIRMSKQLANQSILKMFTEACILFNNIYSLEVITGMERVLKFQIPETAFRETIANALVHRDWQSAADIQVSFFPDKITIISPGSLPEPLTPDDYLNRMISLPRNMNLAIVFQRLGLIERFGTGIGRIRQAYQNSSSQPTFEITDRFISVTLPLEENIAALDPYATKLLSLIRSGIGKKKELIKESDFSSYQVTKGLHLLEGKGLIKKEGNTRAAQYISVIPQ